MCGCHGKSAAASISHYIWLELFAPSWNPKRLLKVIETAISSTARGVRRDPPQSRLYQTSPALSKGVFCVVRTGKRKYTHLFKNKSRAGLSLALKGKYMYILWSLYGWKVKNIFKA